jgi:hypothetical protein
VVAGEVLHGQLPMASKSTAAPRAAFGPVSLSLTVKKVAKPSAEADAPFKSGSLASCRFQPCSQKEKGPLAKMRGLNVILKGALWRDPSSNEMTSGGPKWWTRHAFMHRPP